MKPLHASITLAVATYCLFTMQPVALYSASQHSDTVSCTMQRFGAFGDPFFAEERSLGDCNDTIDLGARSSFELWSIACKRVSGNLQFYVPKCDVRIAPVCDGGIVIVIVIASCSSEKCLQVRGEILKLRRLVSSGDKSATNWKVGYVLNGENLDISNSSEDVGTSLVIEAGDSDSLSNLIARIDSVRLDLPDYVLHVPALWAIERRARNLVSLQLSNVPKLRWGITLDSIGMAASFPPRQLALLALFMRIQDAQSITHAQVPPGDLVNYLWSADSTSTLSRYRMEFVKQMVIPPAAHPEGKVVMQTVTDLLKRESVIADTIHLYFWATWCTNCFSHASQLKDFADSVARRGHAFINIAIMSPEDAYHSSKDKFPGLRLYMRYYADLPLYGSLQRVFSISAVPRLLTITAEGRHYVPNTPY